MWKSTHMEVTWFLELILILRSENLNLTLVFWILDTNLLICEAKYRQKKQKHFSASIYTCIVNNVCVCVGPLSYLGMCAFASRSFSVDRGRPLGHWGLLGLSCEVILWPQPSFPPSAPSLSFSFSFAPSFSFSFARPLCSARRMSKFFLRPGTARRWVKEWVCNEKQRGGKKRLIKISYLSFCGPISAKC